MVYLMRKNSNKEESKSKPLLGAAGREVRESMFEQVAHLFHDLDMGMQPISVLFPYLPIPAHWRRDRRALPTAPGCALPCARLLAGLGVRI